MKQFCAYGCGQTATYQFKNGNWCCSENVAQCPINRDKVRHVPRWNKGLTKGTDRRVKKMAESFEGYKHSEEAKKKISEASKKFRGKKFQSGHTPWNKGKKFTKISGNRHWNWQGGHHSTQFK